MNEAFEELMKSTAQLELLKDTIKSDEWYDVGVGILRGSDILETYEISMQAIDAYRAGNIDKARALAAWQFDKLMILVSGGTDGGSESSS